MSSYSSPSSFSSIAPGSSDPPSSSPSSWQDSFAGFDSNSGWRIDANPLGFVEEVAAVPVRDYVDAAVVEGRDVEVDDDFNNPEGSVVDVAAVVEDVRRVLAFNVDGIREAIEGVEPKSLFVSFFWSRFCIYWIVLRSWSPFVEGVGMLVVVGTGVELVVAVVVVDDDDDG